MTTDAPELPAFGIVDQNAEHGVLSVEPSGPCRLTLVARTERGYPRRELAAIPLPTWRAISSVVQRELQRVMDPEEVGPKAPSFRSGPQALSPLITRELAVLFWSLMEDGEGTHIQTLLAGWRQLAREERWWLYARASNPAQKLGHGWRRALFFALTDPADTRTAPRLLEIMEAASAQKKSSALPRTPVHYRESLKTERKTKNPSLRQKSPEKSLSQPRENAFLKLAKTAHPSPARPHTKRRRSSSTSSLEKKV